MNQTSQMQASSFRFTLSVDNLVERYIFRILFVFKTSLDTCIHSSIFIFFIFFDYGLYWGEPAKFSSVKTFTSFSFNGLLKSLWSSDYSFFSHWWPCESCCSLDQAKWLLPYRSEHSVRFLEFELVDPSLSGVGGWRMMMVFECVWIATRKLV